MQPADERGRAMPDIRTIAYEVESVTVMADDHAGGLYVRGHPVEADNWPDADVLILDGDEDGPGCPMTVDGREVDRWQLLRWVVATRDVRMEIDQDFDMYSRVVAARFTAGAPAG
jgi:hypothetical protein